MALWGVLIVPGAIYYAAQANDVSQITCCLTKATAQWPLIVEMELGRETEG